MASPVYRCWWALCLLLPAAAGSGELAAAAARTELQRYIESTASYSATFTQRVTDADGELAEEGAGQFWLARPGQFRWLYEAPWVREIVADGERIWLYDAELDQVTTQDLTAILEQTPAGLLAGNTSSLDDYTITGSATDDVITIALQPRQGAGDFERITMVLAGRVLTELRLNDRFGQQTLIRFSEPRINIELDPGLFEFVVPAGADVIDESGA